MQTRVTPVFVRAIGRDLTYWSQQIKSGDDEELRQLVPQHSEVLQTAQFAAALSATQPQTVTLIETYFNLIERNGFAHLWLPVVKTLLDATCFDNDAAVRHQLQWRYALLLRLDHQLNAAIEKLETLLEQPLAPHLDGRVRLDLSLCYHQTSRRMDAISQATFAHDIFIACNDDKWRAASLLNLGMFKTDRGQYKEAEAHLKQAYQIEIEGGDATRIVRVLTNFGRLYEMQQQPWRAVRIYFEAQEYVDVVGVEDISRVELNLAHIYNQLKEYDKALALLLSAEKRLQTTPRQQYLSALTQLNLGVTYYYLQQFHAALRPTENAFTAFEQLGQQWLLCRAQVNIADIHSKLGGNEAAQIHYQQAVQALTQLGDQPSMVALRAEAADKLAQFIGEKSAEVRPISRSTS